MAKVTRITISRLFSLGNFEHQKIEVSADVSNTNFPHETFNQLEIILNDLNPNAPYDEYEIESAKRALIQESSPDDFCPFELSKPEAKKRLEEQNAWHTKRKDAMRRLSTL